MATIHFKVPEPIAADRTIGALIPDGMIDVLDHGRDGSPRLLSIEAGSAAQVTPLMKRITVDAEARGFLVLPATTYVASGGDSRDDLTHRTLLLLAPPDVPDVVAVRALIAAACRSPRAHVLLRIRLTGCVENLREARARYAGGPLGSLRRYVPDSREVGQLRERASRAPALIAQGRHAAAERLLREIAGAFQRRRYYDEAARILVAIGRLLLDRGKCERADHAFEEAGAAARLGGDEALHADARVWQARARIESGRLTDAESLCRAAMLLPDLSDCLRLRMQATLAWVLLAQGRLREVAAVDLQWRAERTPDAETMAFVRGMSVRIHLTQRRVFEAGVEARELLDAIEQADVAARIDAETAHLRVLLAAGDLTLADASMRTISNLARSARTPMPEVRARILLADARHRAGCSEAARRDGRRLQRLVRAMPALLRREIADLEASTHAPHRPSVSPFVSDGPSTAELIAAANEPDDDDDAIRQVLLRLGDACHTVRIDVWSHDGGPPSVVMTIGTGTPTRLGVRVLEAGVALGPESTNAGCELGVPVRRGRLLVGGIVARWALDRSPPRDARAMFETAAAVICGRLEARQSTARLVARTAAVVPELVGTSLAMNEVRATIARAAAAPFAVLIQGESGVGKELVARAIHQLSPRRERPFSDINCAALPEELFESELFGHARGAFTGALVERAGLFETATGGTLFLDEVADLSPRGQAKLLRVIQQQEVRRVGETFSRAVDVRLVAAANRDLSTEATGGRFRSDLLYRLDVIRLRIPPLRERPEDIAPLALHLWRTASARVETRATLSHGVLSALARYHWPGNVRELQNVMAALAVAAPSRGHVRAHLLPAAITGVSYVKATRLAEARAQFERRVIESALARHGGNRSRAARELGLSRQGLLKMLARLGVVAAASDTQV